MKFFLRCTLLVMLLLAAAERRAGAQFLTLFVTNTASTLQTSNSLTYNIIVTNISGPTPLLQVTVTNFLPPSVQVSSASYTMGISGFFTNYVTSTNVEAVFYVGTLANNLIEGMSLTVVPTAAGMITNTVDLYTPTPVGPTNYLTTNIVVDVTNPVIDAVLDISMTGPAQAVITNDFMTYGLTVTNLGPDSAPGVLVTNLLPGGVLLLGGSPTNLAFTLYPLTTNANNTATNLVFNIGTLTNGASFPISFVVMPTTNAATNLTLFASVGVSGVTDLDPTNASASTNIYVYDYLTNIVQGQYFTYSLTNITMSSTNVTTDGFTNITVGSTNIVPFDPVTGFIEQSLVVSNISGATVPAMRVVVLGVSNQLYNATGTNDGHPFVDYSTPLAPGQLADLRLQFVRTSPLSTNELLAPFSLPVTPVWTAPSASAFATNVPVTSIQKLTTDGLTGNMLLEFPAATNQTYTVVYSDNVLFSNAQIAVPPIVSQANEVLWVDYGAPGTTDSPAHSVARYYQVYLNP